MFDQRFSVLLAKGSGHAGAELPKARDLLAPQAREQIMARDDWIFTASPPVFACARRAAFESAEAVRQQLTAMFAVFESMPQTVVPTTAEQPGDALIAFLLDSPTPEDAQPRLASLTPADRELVERCQGPMFLLLSGQINREDIAALVRSQDRQTRQQEARQMQRVRAQSGRTFNQAWLRHPGA